MADIYTQARAQLRRDHTGSPESDSGNSRWICSCGKSGGGWGVHGDWQRGFQQHLRAENSKILESLRQAATVPAADAAES